MHKIILLTGLILLAFTSFGQECLLLKHNRKDKTVSYCLGDEVVVLDKNTSKKYGGAIVSLKDSVLVLEKPVKNAKNLQLVQQTYRDYIAISDIEAVYIVKKGFFHKFRYAYSGTAMIGGGVLIGTSSVDTILDGKTPSFEKMIIATGILVSGFIARHLGREKFKIGKNWTIEIEHTEGNPSNQSNAEPFPREKAN